MPTEGGTQIREAAVAAVDLSAHTNLGVKKDAGGEWVKSGDGEAGGILKGAPKAGEQGTAVLAGKSLVVSGAAWNLYDELAFDAAGKVVPATTGEAIIGVALFEAAGGADQTREIYVNPMGTKA
ncbi:MAG TPA: hypothetical protein VLV83_09425 [Acidobacteriota bacterium]|nr:hypothetical protein [Acidobacteriota bacterium]